MSQPTTPLTDALNEKIIERLFTEAPAFEFLILKGHILVEHVLDILIDAALKQPHHLRTGPRVTFERKLAWAQALGTLPAAYPAPIAALNRVRNKIAHVDGYSITLKDLMDFRLDWEPSTVRTLRRDFARDPTEATRFVTALLVLKCMELVYDHERSVKTSP